MSKLRKSVAVSEIQFNLGTHFTFGRWGSKKSNLKLLWALTKVCRKITMAIKLKQTSFFSSKLK
jgi:hypothetical protein